MTLNLTLWRPSSIVLACVLALCVVPGVFSFNSLFPNVFSSFHPAAHPSNFFHQNLFPEFFNFPIQPQQSTKQRRQELHFPTVMECRSMCVERDEQSLANAKYRTESDGNGGINLFIEFQDNGEPIDMKNVALRVREDMSRRIQLHPFTGRQFSHLGYVPQQPSFILDVLLSRSSPVLDDRLAWCRCASAKRVEEYSKSFALPQLTDLSNVQGQLLQLDEKTIALKVHLPKFIKTYGKEIAHGKNQMIDNHPKQLTQEQEQPRLKEQAIADALAEAHAQAQRKAAAEEQERMRQEQLQQLLQQQQILQREREQRELKERERAERAAQLERQMIEERIRQEQLQRERKQQQQQQQQQQQLERQRQLEAEAAAARRAAAAEAEAERLLAERKEKAYRHRYGAEGEVISELGDMNARQSKKYAQLSEERRQWKDSEVVYLD